MCGNGSAERSQRESSKLAEEQFQFQKDQASQAKQDAKQRRAAMEHGLARIGDKFAKFDNNYYEGIADSFRNYANPQIEQSQSSSEFGLKSALANRGKLGSSTAARQTADLVSTYGGIYRDSELKAQDYANQQRGSVNSAKQAAISQMYASESADAGLQAASGSVRSLATGPSYEPVTALLAQASKFANLDYSNSLYGGRSNGLFSPLFNTQPQQQQQNPATSGNDVKTYSGS